jgi:hypothetical protein
MGWPIHSINKENVLPAITVVVKKRAARAKGFGQQLSPVCATIVAKANARGRGYIDEAEAQRWLRRLSKGSRR